MATLRSGHRVPVFHDWHSATKAGYLSRSAWKRNGLLVPESTVPGGVVVTKQGKVWYVDGLFEPILDTTCDKEHLVVAAIDYYYVFNKQQTVPKPIKNRKFREPTGEGSLMTEKYTEVLGNKGVAAADHPKAIDTVNSVRCYVPEGLLDTSCPVRNGLWYFLGLIYWQHLQQRLEWDQPVSLKWDYLRENIPSWTRVWNWCSSRNIVERIGGYVIGGRSYGYRTCSPYREQTHRLVTFEDKLLVKRLRRASRQFYNRPVLTHLRSQLDRISIDMDQFDARFGNHANKRYYLAHLQAICDKEIRFTQDDFSGRIHTNVTNLYKPLRSLLRVDSKKESLGEIDIRNSQPLFLGMAARNRGVRDEHYLELCQQGTIYDHLASRLSVLRDAAKSEFIKMLYAKNGYRSLMKAVFEQEFPAIATFAHTIKVKDHRRLAQQMQKAERQFVIDTVCARLFRERKDVFVATIHDAILARADDCDFALEVTQDEFAKVGMKPRLEWCSL